MLGRFALYSTFLFSLPTLAVALKNPDGFERVKASHDLYLSKPTDGTRASMVSFSEISGSLDPEFLKNTKLQSLYLKGVSEVINQRGGSDVHILSAQKVAVKSLHGVLFTVTFSEKEPKLQQITDHILILASGDKTLHLDFHGPSNRSQNEWRKIVTALEGSLP
jgi:hypothetical protein